MGYSNELIHKTANNNDVCRCLFDEVFIERSDTALQWKCSSDCADTAVDTDTVRNTPVDTELHNALDTMLHTGQQYIIICRFSL